jgi:hypothetical protein
VVLNIDLLKKRITQRIVLRFAWECSNDTQVETFAKRPLLPNSCACPVECAALFLWGQTQILILKILNVFLRLKFSSFLDLNKIEHFSKVSNGERQGLTYPG